jgi:hypothetical protein
VVAGLVVALAGCVAAPVPVPPPSPDGLMTSQQLDYVYSYYENELLPCLRSSGVEIAVIPMRVAFRDGSNHGLTMWTPYDQLRLNGVAVDRVLPRDGLPPKAQRSKNSAVRLATLEAKCPPLPAALSTGMTR